MELRDYLSATAILISLASFGVASWNTRFTRRVKLSELRASVLVKAAEATSRLARIREMQSDMRLHAQEIGDSTGLGLLDEGDVQVRAGSIYERMSALPASHGLKIYEAFLHDVHDLNERLTALEAEMRGARSRYLAITQVPSAGA